MFATPTRWPSLSAATRCMPSCEWRTHAKPSAVPCSFFLPFFFWLFSFFSADCRGFAHCSRTVARFAARHVYGWPALPPAPVGCDGTVGQESSADVTSVQVQLQVN